MICRKKQCGGDVSLTWNDSDIKDGPFMIEGECEKCHAMYTVVMQLFKKTKPKKGTRVFFDADFKFVQKCSDCPYYGSHLKEGIWVPECDATGKRIRDPSKFPNWCSLPRVVR